MNHDNAVARRPTVTDNAIAGSGQNSHEVPSAEGRVVLIRDGHHRGTDVYRLREAVAELIAHRAQA